MQKKQLYTELLRTGDLFDMYIGMLGTWDEDKYNFSEQQDALETFTNNIDTDAEFIN